jgi:hypothetical protein
MFVSSQFSTIKLQGDDGSLVWQAYDWTGYHNGVAALALDGQGGVYVTGGIDPDGDESNLNDNIYTVKRDAQGGALVWTHLYGANCLGCWDFSGDLQVDPEGHVYIGGSTNSPPYGADAILLVLDAATGLETDRGIVSGGALEDASWGRVHFDGDYNVLLGGEMSHFNTGYVDMAVARYKGLGGAISCAEARSFRTACVNGGSGNRLDAYLTLTDSSHHGQQVSIEVDGVPFLSTVRRSGAELSLRGLSAGPHVVALTDPAGCFAPLTAVCPASAPPFGPLGSARSR